MKHGAARPARHDLLVVAPEHWPAVLATFPRADDLSAAQRALLDRWGPAGWPVIARRPAFGDAGGAVPVGVPLPPDLGKRRVALAIPSGVPWRGRDGLSVAAARSAAPPAWTGTLDAVEALADALGLCPRVFGALLWQALTGLRYLHDASDLDLLWPVAEAGQIPALLDGLARIDAAGAVRLDGEVLIGAAGVNWRELADARRGAADSVLAKTRDGARLLPVDRLDAPEPAPCC